MVTKKRDKARANQVYVCLTEKSSKSMDKAAIKRRQKRARFHYAEREQTNHRLNL